MSKRNHACDLHRSRGCFSVAFFLSLSISIIISTARTTKCVLLFEIVATAVIQLNRRRKIKRLTNEIM